MGDAEIDGIVFEGRFAEPAERDLRQIVFFKGGGEERPRRFGFCADMRRVFLFDVRPEFGTPVWNRAFISVPSDEDLIQCRLKSPGRIARTFSFSRNEQD